MGQLSIGLARDLESPENPGAMDQRVALSPTAVAALSERGCAVAVEVDAGVGIGFSNDDYRAAGAEIESHAQVYSAKSLVIKLKAMGIDDIQYLDPGTTLLCMAHNRSFPQRAALLLQKKITVVAMEELRHTPNWVSDDIIVGKVGMRAALQQWPLESAALDITFIGYSERTVGAIRRAGNRNPRSIALVQCAGDVADLRPGPGAAYVYDGEANAMAADIGETLAAQGCPTFDLAEYAANNAPECIARYRRRHPPFEFGGRRIECLHETGAAGAAYGLKLLAEVSPLRRPAAALRPVVLGYGNVGMGAIHRLFEAGVPRVEILTRHTTTNAEIGKYLAATELVINGAELPVELRGTLYLLSERHTREILPDGAVVIDLVGGSPTNRSAVENVRQCSFLDDPFFIADGIYFSALWGWPMMGMMKESALKYSAQLLQVLCEPGGLLAGVAQANKSVQQAVVSGPFDTA